MSNSNPPHVDVAQVPDGDHRVNTQEDPAGNFLSADSDTGTDAASEVPRRPEGTDHFGQDGERGTLTAGEAQRLLGHVAEQNLPAMDQNNATPTEKLQGIVAQTIADSEFQPRDRLAEHLRARIDDAGLVISEEGLAAALRAIESALDHEEGLEQTI